MNLNDIATTACQCEHMDHFETPEDAVPQHKYLAQFPEDSIHEVKTPFGTYHMCRKCIKECTPFELIVPEKEMK